MQVFKNGRTDIRAWIAFLLGVVVCVLAISYGEIRNEPSALLVFNVTSTKPGILKVIFTKDGQFTDLGWVVNFPEDNTRQTASYPLSPGQYDLIGFKPLIETGGRVTINNLKIISGTGIRYISEGNFATINQLDKISAQNGGVVIAPAQGANDPFGAFPNLHEIVPKPPFVLSSLLWIATGKLALIAVIVMLMYGLSRNLPFARGLPNEPRPEPGLSSWLGFLAVGLVVLYLRNAYSIFVPVLYAEDGDWSAGLINRGFFNMLFNARPQADYFVFGNVLLLALAQLCNTAFFGHNLTYLPHFVSFTSMLFYAALAVAPVILLRDALRIEARLLLWLLVLLVPLGNSSYEVLGRLSNIGYVCLFLAFCLLVWRHYSLQSGPRKHIVATDAMLFLCANTNPLCYPLIAVAFGVEAWRNWQTGRREKLFIWSTKYWESFISKSALVLLGALFLTGTWIALRMGLGEGPSASSGHIIMTSVPEAIVARSFLYPFIFPIYSYFNNIKSIFTLLIVVLTIFFLVKNVRRERLILQYATAVLILSTVVTVGSRSALTIILDQYQTTFPDRYYFGLNLFVFLISVFALSAGFGDDKKGGRRVAANLLAGVLVALYAGNSAFMFEFSKPRFPWLPKTTFFDEIQEGYTKGGQDGLNEMSYQVALDPTPWSTHFPAKYVTATILGVRSVPLSIAGRYSNLGQPTQPSISARRYDGELVRQMPAGRGRDDGWFYVSGGVRSWISDISWLEQNNLSPADVIEISHEDFSSIPDSGLPVR